MNNIRIFISPSLHLFISPSLHLFMYILQSCDQSYIILKCLEDKYFEQSCLITGKIYLYYLFLSLTLFLHALKKTLYITCCVFHSSELSRKYLVANHHAWYINAITIET